MAEGKLRETDFDALPEQNEEAAEEKRRRKAELLEAREKDRKRRELAIILVVVLVIAFVTILAVIISRESSARRQEEDREIARRTEAGTDEPLTLRPETQESEKVVIESTPDNDEAPSDATVPEGGSESADEPSPETEEPESVGPGYADAEELRAIKKPSWVEEALLTVSEYSRPGFALTEANNIVIHYVGNPGTTAMGNRDYFESLSDPKQNPTGHGASSHYVVGLQGEIIQCIPLYEVAFANYPRNYDTISIEVCHPDEGGEFNNDTYWALVRLAAYLLEKTGMNPEQLIRHYDVSGKLCPIFYVEHPEAWTQFKHAVGEYMKEHPDIETEFP